MFRNKVCLVYKSLVIFLIAMIFVLFVLANGTQKEYVFDTTQTIQAGTGRAIIKENISLSPGIYQVELEYDANSDMKYLCGVEDNIIGDKYVLTNGECLYAGLSKTSYNLTLLKATDTLRVFIQGSGEEVVQIGALVIRNTNQLYSVLGTMLIFVLLILIFAFNFIKCAKGKQNYVILLGILLITFASSIPYLQRGSLLGADGVYHMLRIEGVKDGILNGQFPVRIEPEWIHGYGYANSIFYCNTMLLLPGLLRIAGFTVDFSYKAYCIAMNLFTAGLSYYCFSKIFKDKYIGLISSGLYTLSIYRIYKFLVRFHIGEATALTFMPLIIYGFYRVFSENAKSKEYKTAWIPLAFGYGGLIQTHVLSCEIAAFLTIITCLIYIKKIFVKETFWELAKGAIATILLSLWYLVPFLDYYINENVHIKHVSDRKIQEFGIVFKNFLVHFWKNGGSMKPAETGVASSEPLGLGLLLFVAFCVFAVMWILGFFKEKSVREIAIGKLSWCYTGILCAMTLHVFPWDKIQFMNRILKSLVSSLQYPTRFLGWGTAFCVCMIGSLIWYLKNYKNKLGYYCCCVGAVLAITTSSMCLIYNLCKDGKFISVYNPEGMGFGYLSGAEYLIEGTDASNLLYDEPVVSDQVELVHWEKGSLEMSLDVRSIKRGYIDLPLLLYKGYKAYATDAKINIEMTYGENNVIRLLIPEKFSDTITVRFVSPIYWRISEAISGITIIFLCLYCKKNFKR